MDTAFEEAPEELIASDDDADEYKHAKLLQAIGNLDGKRKIAELQRTEPAGKASEFHLAPGTGKVAIKDLVGALKKSGSGKSEVNKQLNRVQAKQKLLNTPLPKNELDKIQRTLAYEGTTVEVTKWDPVVTKNRKAEQLTFPLGKPAVQLRTTKQMTKGHQPRTPLEIEVAKLLAGSKNVTSTNKELTEAEERALQAMSIEEAKERRAELQKYRALLSYKEAKARRQKKIKSKKFHRILRKEKEKKEKKVLDDLEGKDPEAYADMLLKLQKDRIEERMSLKHRSGSKFMKRQQIYGKFNDKTRQTTADMLEKGKELRQKVGDESSSSDDNADDKSDEEEDAGEKRYTPSGIPVAAAAANPWMAKVQPETRRTKPEAMVNKFKEADEQDSNESEEEMEENGEILSVEKKKKGTNEESDESDDEESEEKKEKEAKEAKISGMGIDDIFLDAQLKMKKSAEEKRAKRKEAVETAREKRKALNEKKKQKQKEKVKQKKRRKGESSSSESESDSDSDEEQIMSRKRKDLDETEQLRIDPNEEGLSASLKRKQTMDDFEAEWSDGDEQKAKLAQSTDTDNTKSSSKQKRNEPQVDPKKYLTVTTRLESSQDPTLIEGDGEDMEDAEDQQRLTIAQAFAQDDVVEEFRADKMAAIQKDKPKEIDLTLPGWGDWGGTGVSTSKKKRKRFTIKAPQTAPRKDTGLKGVIISETKDTTIKKHQVKSIPFPFTSVNQFEASVRAPVGKTWNPENSYRKLIQPKVVTKMGTVIEPMDKAEVFKKQANQLPDSDKGDNSKHGGKGKKKKGGNQQKKKKKKSD